VKDRARLAKEFLREHWGRLLTGAVLLAVFFGNGGFRSLTRNWLELRRLNKEIVALQAEEKELDGHLKALRSGDGPVERLARRELGYIKKGEIEYRFPPPEKKRE
jgi:cell division protein FtsB